MLVHLAGLGLFFHGKLKNVVCLDIVSVSVFDTLLVFNRKCKLSLLGVV